MLRNFPETISSIILNDSGNTITFPKELSPLLEENSNLDQQE